jgi:hypothetical protein
MIVATTGTAIELKHAYTFDVVDRLLTSLKPRGALRLQRARARVTTDAVGGHARFNATLLFSSLLEAPHYQELVLTHYTLPSPGRHGPFLTNALSPAAYREVPRAELRARIAQSLSFSRYATSPIAPAAKARVVDLVASLLRAPMRAYRLDACDWFNAADNSVYPHEWSHAVLEFHEYVLFDTQRSELVSIVLVFD